MLKHRCPIQPVSHIAPVSPSAMRSATSWFNKLLIRHKLRVIKESGNYSFSNTLWSLHIADTYLDNYLFNAVNIEVACTCKAY